MNNHVQRAASIKLHRLKVVRKSRKSASARNPRRRDRVGNGRVIVGFLHDTEKLGYRMAGFNRVSEVSPGVQTVFVTAPGAIYFEIALMSQICDYFLHGPLSYAHYRCDFSHFHVGLSAQTNENMRMVGEKGPMMRMFLIIRHIKNIFRNLHTNFYTRIKVRMSRIF